MPRTGGGVSAGPGGSGSGYNVPFRFASDRNEYQLARAEGFSQGSVDDDYLREIVESYLKAIYKGFDGEIKKMLWDNHPLTKNDYGRGYEGFHDRVSDEAGLTDDSFDFVDEYGEELSDIGMGNTEFPKDRFYDGKDYALFDVEIVFDDGNVVHATVYYNVITDRRNGDITDPIANVSGPKFVTTGGGFLVSGDGYSLTDTRGRPKGALFINNQDEREYFQNIVRQSWSQRAKNVFSSVGFESGYYQQVHNGKLEKVNDHVPRIVNINILRRRR